MNDNIIFTQISLEKLAATIKSCIKEELAASKLNDNTKLNISDPELLTIVEISKLFKVSKVTIHAWVKKGLLKPIKRSSRTYFIKSEIIAGINSNNTKKK